jgi:hypothetical protein
LGIRGTRQGRRYGAIRPGTHAWVRHVVAMDPPTLVLAEQAMYDPTQPALAVPM